MKDRLGSGRFSRRFQISVISVHLWQDLLGKEKSLDQFHPGQKQQEREN